MKTCIKDLAILGGEPAFHEKLYVNRPNIGEKSRLFERIQKSIDNKWLTNHGKFVQEFEAKLTEFLGVKHCIVTCNATIGLELAIRALGVSGEVIVPSFTFVATAHAVQWLGLTPVFCDIDPVTHNLDPEQVEKAITSRTQGIMGVHLWGRACDITALTHIAENHTLKLLFDAAHAFGCSYQGKKIGNFGEAEVFSFHATKFFNTFEGGAIATNNDDLAQTIRQMKNFGLSDGMVISSGTNGKMNEISAAMGLTNLECLEEFVAVNAGNYAQYQLELGPIAGVSLLQYDENDAYNYQYIVIEIDETVTQICRDQLVAILHSENIFASRYFFPGCHRMEPYSSLFPEASLKLPETEQLVQRVIVLPTGTAISPEDVTHICQIIRLAVTHGRQLQEWFVTSQDTTA